MKMKKQYEYKRLHIYTDHSNSEAEDELVVKLNELGLQGWELVSFINGEAVLKREIQIPDKSTISSDKKEILHG